MAIKLANLIDYWIDNEIDSVILEYEWSYFDEKGKRRYAHCTLEYPPEKYPFAVEKIRQKICSGYHCTHVSSIYNHGVTLLYHYVRGSSSIPPLSLSPSL